jgi:transcriptional regulator with XRE-family HTH domain
MQQEVTKAPHQGRNVKRIREILGIKQEALASDLGLSQQAVSQLEQKEALDKEMLEKIAGVLKVPVDAIRNFDEEGAINIVSSTFKFSDHSIGYAKTYSPSFNPLDKIVELYERMLKDKSEMIEKLERLLGEKK